MYLWMYLAFGAGYQSDFQWSVLGRVPLLEKTVRWAKAKGEDTPSSTEWLGVWNRVLSVSQQLNNGRDARVGDAS